jgi:hypothetical protein
MIEERSEAEDSSEEDLDLIEEEDQPLPPDTSPEATAEAKLTEGEQKPADERVELEDGDDEVTP